MTTQLVPLSDPTWDLVNNHISKTFPEVCVITIHKVINCDIYQRFQNYAAENAKTHSISEWVYHGTQAKNVDSIVERGFMRAYNKVAAHGPGTYFSTRWGYSKDYSNTETNGISCLFLCRVCMPTGYAKPAGHMYVVADDAACMPEYLIEYVKKE